MSSSIEIMLDPAITVGNDAGDSLWQRLRREADDALRNSPALAPLLHGSILDQPSFAEGLFHRISARLRNDVIEQPSILQAFRRASAATPELNLGWVGDLLAVLDRDPACKRLIEPFLYFKGFHALQAHRLTHWLWNTGERDFALYLQSRSSEVFQTDIHPAARIGRRVFLDHATGLVVGETAVIGDDVSLLQGVTLGGTGKLGGDRHPKIGRGVVIGAGAKILGNISVGDEARIAAASVVLASVPARATVAGIPARVVRVAASETPSPVTPEVLTELSYAVLDYTI